jgi:Flp pilus assembly protein TadG
MKVQPATNKTNSNRQRGHAIVELALMCPWILLLFLGLVDFGFYAYAAITTQNAARVAVLVTASSPATAASQTAACLAVREEMQQMTNYSSLPAGCGALPLLVQTTQVVGPDGENASRVLVSYRTVQLFSLPFFPGQMTITRTAEMRIFGE